MKYATTIDEQINKLQSRGLIIKDRSKAKEILLDIGYYRFCSYLFPFELSYPRKRHRLHFYSSNTNLEDGLDLYYFDFDLRRLLLKYLFRIEVNIRTYITYYVSNHYKSDPCWFISPAIMHAVYVNHFDKTFYIRLKRNNPIIIEHHRNHPGHHHAPAWKTIEQMPFGNVQILFNSIIDAKVRQDISRHYGVSKLKIFDDYINTIRLIRNNCAHGSVIFDMKLPLPIHNGPAGHFNNFTNSNIIGIIDVIKFFLKQISIHRYTEFCHELDNLLDRVTNSKVREILKVVSGFNIK